MPRASIDLTGPGTFAIVDANAPSMTIAANGIGAPIVISDLGTPFIVNGYVPPEED